MPKALGELPVCRRFRSATFYSFGTLNNSTPRPRPLLSLMAMAGKLPRGSLCFMTKSGWSSAERRYPRGCTHRKVNT